MTSQGSVSGQFHRALRRGNATIALGLAYEVKNVTLADALALCLLFKDDQTKFPRFAARWHARFVTELGVASYTESQLVLTSLFSLVEPQADAARAALDSVFHRHGRADLVDALHRKPDLTHP